MRAGFEGGYRFPGARSALGVPAFCANSSPSPTSLSVCHCGVLQEALGKSFITHETGSIYYRMSSHLVFETQRTEFLSIFLTGNVLYAETYSKLYLSRTCLLSKRINWDPLTISAAGGTFMA